MRFAVSSQSNCAVFSLDTGRDPFFSTADNCVAIDQLNVCVLVVKDHQDLSNLKAEVSLSCIYSASVTIEWSILYRGK